MAHDPRANQKERTRAAIVEAATRLMREGAAPSVADAAAAAKVSRATAYRYFPTPEALHLEIAGITPKMAPVEAVVAGLDGEDAAAGAMRVLDALNGAVFTEEAQMRMALKVYQDIWFGARETGEVPAPLREGRRMRWLEKALAPAGLSRARQRRLEAALALTAGVEALVVMKDVCRLEEREARDVLRWAAQTLLAAGLAPATWKARPVDPDRD